ncbi:hypothetical protein [Jiangella alkaliphila]|uniref:hypothetical protein n=1 Tax=Jiangella alkaliphila TaxID=419479 RepID=UPI0006999495|nr:hypothetical protein [Jiangella alkaliphila]
MGQLDHPRYAGAQVLLAPHRRAGGRQPFRRALGRRPVLERRRGDGAQRRGQRRPEPDEVEHRRPGQELPGQCLGRAQYRLQAGRVGADQLEPALPWLAGAGATAAVRYPRDLPTDLDWDDPTGTLTVGLPALNAARLIELRRP